MPWLEDGGTCVGVIVWWTHCPIGYQVTFHFLMKFCAEVCPSFVYSHTMSMDIKWHTMIKNIQNLLDIAHDSSPISSSISSPSEHQAKHRLVSTTLQHHKDYLCWKQYCQPQVDGQNGALKASPFTTPEILHSWETLILLTLLCKSPMLKTVSCTGYLMNGHDFWIIKYMLIIITHLLNFRTTSYKESIHGAQRKVHH